MVMSLADSARKLKPPQAQNKGGRRKHWHCPAVLMTDQALTAPQAALSAFPRGGLVVVRAHQQAQQRHLITTLAQTARQRGVVLAVSDHWRLLLDVAQNGMAVGVHLPERVARRGPSVALRLWRRQRGVVLTVACHDRAALARAKALRADAAFLSPVYPTASHPGARCLGGLRAALMARRAGLPVLALGGVSARRTMALTAQGFSGFAAVRGWVHPAAER
jgi:thiamine-phosphate pyrophosphorylase